MPLPFDATMKDLATQSPPDFLTTFDTPPASPGLARRPAPPRRDACKSGRMPGKSRHPPSGRAIIPADGVITSMRWAGRGLKR